jgi:hypothetical protein
MAVLAHLSLAFTPLVVVSVYPGGLVGLFGNSRYGVALLFSIIPAALVASRGVKFAFLMLNKNLEYVWISDNKIIVDGGQRIPLGGMARADLDRYTKEVVLISGTGTLILKRPFSREAPGEIAAYITGYIQRNGK